MGSACAGTMYMQLLSGVACESGIQVVSEIGPPSGRSEKRPRSRCGFQPASPLAGSTFHSQKSGSNPYGPRRLPYMASNA